MCIRGGSCDTRFEGKDDNEFVTMFLGTYNCKVGLPEKIGE
jgi:hypothetical protein